MESLLLIKIGGNIIDNPRTLEVFLESFAKIEGKKVLIHGGGIMASSLAEKLNIPVQMKEGRRITDTETLKVVTMVYAGLVNKQIVAGLQAFHCNAMGLSGADGSAVLAHKRSGAAIDYGFAGDVDLVNASLFHGLLQQGLIPVIAPITHDGKGQLLNTNADTMAREIGLALSSIYQVHLVYSFEKSGVLANSEDDNSVMSTISMAEYQSMKENGSVHSGMIPKLDNAFAALEKGIQRITIGKATNLAALVSGKTGTALNHE